MKRIKIVKVFAEKVKSTLFLKNPLGSRKPLLNQSDVQAFADGDVEKGFEAIKGDVGFGDVSNMFWYVTALIRHIYDRGVPEFSPYEAYKAGAVVSHDGKLWITHRDVEPSIVIKESAPDPCNCCQTTMVEDGYPHYPSKDTGWCYLVDSCELQDHIDRLEAKDKAIIKMIEDLESIKSFTLEKDGDNYSLVITTERGTKFPVTLEAIRKALAPSMAGNGLVAENGVLKVKPADFVDGKTISVDKNGKARIDPDWVDHNIKEPFKAVNDKITDFETNGVQTFANAPIKGNGTRTSPLNLDVSEEFQVIGGKLYLKDTEPKKVTDLNNLSQPIRRLGFTPFYGEIHKAKGEYVIGMPANYEAEAPQTGTTEISQIKDGSAYDFNGWQLASSREVQQFVSNYGVTWERSNDAGMRPDGTLADPSQWGPWKRSTNVNITSEQVANLVDQLTGLTSRLTAVEQLLAGFVPLKDASGRTQIGLIKP